MSAVPSARRRAAGLLAGLAACAFALGGCGGDDDPKSATALLKRAFNAPISSASVKLDVKIEVDGIEELKEPIRFKLEGPYSSAEGGRIPSFDWELSLSGGGQSLAAGLVSTTDNVFVAFQGTAYEVGEREVAGFNRQLAAAEERQQEGGLGRFGIDPVTWLGESREEGIEDVAGVETTHVTAKLDVGRMLDDLNKLVDRAGGAVAAPAPPKLTDEQKKQVQEVVDDPRFDVYVGKDDRIRRLSADLRLEVPDSAREQARGLEGGTISFSIEFSDVGKKQTIEAPSSARPIAELAQQLGGLGALAGGVGPQNGTPPPSGGGPDRSGAPPADQAGSGFERYSRCLEEADPSKLEEIERCSELLR